MPPYPTRSYVRAHPSFHLNDGSETQSPTKRSPSKRSPSKQSPGKRSQPSKRPRVKVMTLPTFREGSVQPTPRATDPTTPQTFNMPTSEELVRAPRKLRRGSNVAGGDDGSWLTTHREVREDVSPLTSFAPGGLSMLPEVEVEVESNIQGEYVSLMKSREEDRKVLEREKENRTVGGPIVESTMGVNQAANSSMVRADYPVRVRGVRRTDSEEVFN